MEATQDAGTASVDVDRAAPSTPPPPPGGQREGMGFMKPLPSTCTHWGETRRKSGGGGYFGSFATALEGNGAAGGVGPLPSAATQWGARRRPSGGVDQKSHRRRSAPARSGSDASPQSSPTPNELKQPTSSEPAPGSPPSSPTVDEREQVKAYAAALDESETIVNEGTRVKLANLHTAMVKAVVKSDLAAATRSFKQLLEISSMEGQRLTALMKARTELYGILAARSGCLGQIEPFCDSSALNENGRLQQLSLSTLSETDCFALFSEVDDRLIFCQTNPTRTHSLRFNSTVNRKNLKSCPDLSILKTGLESGSHGRFGGDTRGFVPGGRGFAGICL
mmetsp:Transcript_102794/g.294624  ORF Transcript_102794/g.294624 Transcript_102794/m.294624 type:complete len:336 (-) Transcript_102794:995-2002(-)